MTPERWKYLFNISNDELMIRNQIKKMKNQIFRDKHGLQNFKFDDSTIKELKTDIRECKVAIRALKRQLPTPWVNGIVCLGYGRRKMKECPICKNPMQCFKPSYCDNCGHKMR